MKSKKFSLVIKEAIKDFKKTIVVDSDKSTSIRSFLLGSISQGISSVKNVLESEDVFSTINCLKKLKVKVLYLGNKTYKIFGKGLGSYNAKNLTKLNFGNSGTLARLIIGIIASTPNINLKVFGDKEIIQNYEEYIQSLEMRITTRGNIVKKNDGLYTYWFGGGLSFGYEF